MPERFTTKFQRLVKVNHQIETRENMTKYLIPVPVEPNDRNLSLVALIKKDERSEQYSCNISVRCTYSDVAQAACIS